MDLVATYSSLLLSSPLHCHCQGVVGISDIIVKPGLINVDFADVRCVCVVCCAREQRGSWWVLKGTALRCIAVASICLPYLSLSLEDCRISVKRMTGVIRRPRKC